MSNQQQRSEDGPLLVISGAGTGKTTVITRCLTGLILSGTK